MTTVFPAPISPQVAIKDLTARFPVHRIYCVGRNYADHAVEMGSDPERDPPFFFSKPADAVVPNHSTIAYPVRTRNLHHEVELVVAIGKAGSAIAVENALDYVFGYAVGIDLTRRDLQHEAREKGRPWDTSKGFDESAPISAIYPVAAFGHCKAGEIWIKVNDEIKQKSDIGLMTWKVPEIIAELSTLFTLQPGDLIYTGTPAGVGKLKEGDCCEAYIAGLEKLTLRIGASQ